jgi:hypothetical protein
VAYWAKENSRLVTLDKHVRWDVPVECMMAFPRLVGVKTRQLQRRRTGSSTVFSGC